MLTTLATLPPATASDLMDRAVPLLRQTTPLRIAARTLAEKNLDAAPIVDTNGRCVGVLSTAEIMRFALEHNGTIPALPLHEQYVSAWELMDSDMLGSAEVEACMTGFPVTVSPAASLHELARVMTEAHTHVLVVVDGDDRPVGLVDSTDILKAIAGTAPEAFDSAVGMPNGA